DGKLLALEGLISDITERKRAEKRMAVFSWLGEWLSSTRTAISAARIVASVSDELLGWDAFTLLLYSPEEDLLYPVLDLDLVEGKRMEFASGDSPVPPGSLSLQVMEKGPQLLLPDYPSAEFTGLRPFGDTGRPSASLMFVPIHSGVGTIGVLSIQSYTPNAYTEPDLSTLQTLADHCGGALERIQAEEALRESQERFRILFEHSPDGVLLMDPHDPQVPWRIVECNDAVCQMNGYKRQELIGQSVALLHSETVERTTFDEHLERLRLGADKVDITHRRKDGLLLSVEALSSLVTVGGREMVLGIERDITERKVFEEQLRHQAFHDPLTGLPNRVLFAERLGHALVRATRHNQPVAVLYLDLDRFKWINDSLGHDVGDALLVAIADRLRICLRPGDTAARLGGDEFVVLLEDIAGEPDAKAVAERIDKALCPAFAVAGREVTITTSIGIATSTTGYEGPYELVSAADIAMYRAKKNGKARYEVFDPGVDSQPTDSLELEADLRHAIERGELRLYYQPKVELATGKMIGVEALLRWEHPRRGLVLPEQFIPIAEETGLILPIGRWILDEACTQAREWQRQYPGTSLTEMCVNVSARQFGHPELIEHVGEALRETGLNPRKLVLEITESAVMDNAESSVATLLKLKRLGVQVAIDDFGTGYSSLSYLRRFPVDVVKIDRSFVDGLGLDPDDTAIVRAVTGLADALHLHVVAEGVETDAQRRQLQALGCTMGQGYYFSGPLPSEEIDTLLAEDRKLLV
ncbi:MAG: EAL domain-containing protein, partial [Chloroflexota bacterium]|nr:EAL domain-containing protein [Chloroflexota bacterium]